MTNQLHTFAEAAAGSNMFVSLGIDWKMLIFQGVAFLILIWVMAKWVFPPLMKAVDERQNRIEESTKAAEAAEKKAESAESKIEDTLKEARREAADIVSTAKDEATAMIDKAEDRAKARSERIVAEAHETLEKDVIAARQSLKNETLQLVKQASSLATAGVADSKLDVAMIKKSVEGAKR